MDPNEVDIEELAKLFAFVADDQELTEWHCHYFIQQAFRLVHELHIKELHRRLDELGERLSNHKKSDDLYNLVDLSLKQSCSGKE